MFFPPGIKIVGGKSTVGGGDYGIFVKKILAGGRAEAEGNNYCTISFIPVFRIYHLSVPCALIYFWFICRSLKRRRSTIRS